MKKLTKNWCFVFLVVCILTFITGCTQQKRAKNYGGTATESLPSGKKLVNVTWKDSNLWLLTRPMSTNDIAETYEFVEASSWGFFEGKIIIVEKK